VSSPTAGKRGQSGPAWATVALALMVSPAAASPPASSEDTLRVVQRSLAEGDWLAARSRLEETVAARPEDCTVRAWLAWVEIESGRWNAAESLLAAPGCPVVSEDRGRWALLKALGSDARNDAESVRDVLSDVDERQPLWPEDRALVRALSGRHVDGYTIPLEARIEIALGGASNAFAASPVDAARLEAPGSAVARPELHLRLRAPEGALTPSVELGARGYGISTAAARELSHAELSAAAAVRLGRDERLPTLRYRHEELLLDAVGWRYSVANEGEIELSPSRALTVFAGLGRRVFFTEPWRTRTEWDLAALRATSVAHRPFVLGGAFRLYRARRTVHDQVGGTLTAATDLPVRAGLRARFVLSGSIDDFPHSGGQDGLAAFGTAERRRDATVRLSAGLWHPLTATVALGLTYELGRRWSTADAPGLRYYPYVDHRLLVSLRIAAGGNPWRARSRAAAPDRVQLPYRDVGEWSVLWDDQLRRLLREEEDLGADCGCTVP
jgi:hypothetical protein